MSTGMLNIFLTKDFKPTVLWTTGPDFFNFHGLVFIDTASYQYDYTLLMKQLVDQISDHKVLKVEFRGKPVKVVFIFSD